MILLYILLATYIAAVNFLAFRLIKSQRDGVEAGDREEGEGDGKLLLAAALGVGPPKRGPPAARGAATAMYATMFILRYRLENCLLMIALPLLAVVNLYCFYLGFRGIALFL